MIRFLAYLATMLLVMVLIQNCKPSTSQITIEELSSNRFNCYVIKDYGAIKAAGCFPKEYK